MSIWRQLPGWLKCGLIIGGFLFFLPFGLAGAALIAFLLTPFGIPIWLGAAIAGAIIWKLASKK